MNKKIKRIKIVKERVTAYVLGMVLGVVIALYYYSQNTKEKWQSYVRQQQ